MTTQYGTWRKSRTSEANGACIEVAPSAHGTIGVRDSKQTETGPILDFSTREWAAFMQAVRSSKP
ncbi:DUF397 domain-containing protein [Spirillospora sp. NBC_00431]